MMNRYTDLSNTIKASLLYQLFPSEIPAVLEFMAQQTDALLANPAGFKMQHDTRLFSFERLVHLSKEVKTCLKNVRPQFRPVYHKRRTPSRTFIEPLFRRLGENI